MADSTGEKTTLTLTDAGNAKELAPPPQAAVDPKLNLGYLLRALVKYQASDLHVKQGRPPLYRINGKVVAAGIPPLNAPQIEHIFKPVLTERLRKVLESSLQVDFSVRSPGLGGFRCNVFFQRGSLAAAVRMIPEKIPTIDEYGLPGVLKTIAERRDGLVIAAGATGSGKSSTLAAMIEHINRNRCAHVVTLEDPIEFLFKDGKSTITQRELGQDASDFHAGIRASLRQDPDVIMIGELRDKETIELALVAAETGHLVLTTIHTSDAKGTVERIIDAFPSEGRAHVRHQIASHLAAVVSQRLVLKADGSGRAAVCEILVNSPGVETHIRDGELAKLPELIEAGGQLYGMRSFNQSLEELVGAGVVTEEEALRLSNNPEDLKLRLGGIQQVA